MRVWTHEHTFNHPWETVAQAAWRKYPNPMNPSVIGIDVLRRGVEFPATAAAAPSSQHGGVLVTERLISSRWGIPRWATAIIGQPSVCYGHERSRVDPTHRRMTLSSRNLSFVSNLSVDEEIVYMPHPEHPDTQTLLRQEAVITCRGVALTNYVEGLISSLISKNASKGREAMEWVIGKIDSEMSELARSAGRLTDQLRQETHDSLSQRVDELTSSAKKLTDNLTHRAECQPSSSSGGGHGGLRDTEDS